MSKTLTGGEGRGLLDIAAPEHAELRARAEKAEWQAEAVEQAANDLYDALGLSPEHLDFLASRADQLRRDAAPQTSLAKLKAQWQAEALEESYRDFAERGLQGAILLRVWAAKLRRKAEGRS